MEIYLYHDPETDRYICSEQDLLDPALPLPYVHIGGPCGHRIHASLAVVDFLKGQKAQKQCPICQSFGRELN